MRTLMFTYNGWEYPVPCYPCGGGWLGWADLPLSEHGRPELVRLWIPPVGQVEVAVLEGAVEIEDFLEPEPTASYLSEPIWSPRNRARLLFGATPALPA